MVGGDIGHHGGNGLAGEGLFGRPEQFAYAGGPDQHQRFGRKTKTDEARPIGQAHFLGVMEQLEVDNRRSTLAKEVPRLPQGKAEHRAGMAAFVGPHFLEQAGRRQGKALSIAAHHWARLGQSRLALDIGNSVPQRREALLASGRVHGWGFPNC